MDYLSEAFKQLEILNEDVFDLDKDGLEDLRDFQDEDEEEVIDVIDPEAETEEELEDSYIGKVILDCSVCHTDIYKDKEDVIIDEETQLANVGEECPYCFSVDGFKVIGEVKPFVETEFETEDDVDVEVDGEEVEEDEDEEEKNESLRKRDKKSMDESLRRKSLKESQATDYESMMLIGQFKDLHKKVRHIEKLINSRFSVENDDDVNAVYDILYEEFERIRSSKDWSPYYFDSDGGEISMITDGRENPQSYVLLSLEPNESFSFYFDMTGYDDDVDLSDYLEKYPQMSKFFDTALFKFFPRFIAALMRRFSSASRNESISRRNRKSLTEAPVYSLEPRYDARKSFYGKAQVDTGDKGDKNKLYSYGTLVAEIKDGKPVVYGTYSATTLRHIKDWLKQNGFRADTSKQIVADYGVKDEACTGKDCARKPRKPMKESTGEKESKAPVKISRKSLKEGWNTKDVERFLKGAVKDIMDEKGTCATMKLDNRLAVCVGWSDGYYDDDVSVIHAKNDPEWGMNAGIKVWTSDSMRTDFDFINAPYNEDTGDVWDTSVSISPDEDYASLASYFEEEYDKMKEYEIEKDGKIVGKWSEDEDEEEFESLNRKSRKKNIKESVGQDVSEYQKWVDYDMKKYKKISKETMSKIKKAGLSVVKDQYGDYEVIADRKDEACNGRKSRKIKESIEDKLSNKDLERFKDKLKIISNHANMMLKDTEKQDLTYQNVEDYMVVADGFINSLNKIVSNNSSIKESIEDITIDTGDQEITVSAKEKEDVESDGEMIAPISDETKDEIETNSEETEEENGEEVDVDMDEFSEEEFDDLGESYLKKVYENVDSYKTTSVSEKGNKLKVEGLIKFTSGKTKKTSFVFEAKTIDKNGHAKFLGENLQISRGHKSFKLSGTISNNKFIAESLNYNYRAKTGKSSQRVYGTVKVDKK